MTRWLAGALFLCGGGAVVGILMLALGAGMTVGWTHGLRLVALAVPLAGFASGVALAHRVSRRSFRDGAVAQTGAGIVLGLAAAVPATPGSVAAAAALFFLCFVSSALLGAVVATASTATKRPAWAVGWLSLGAALAAPVGGLLSLLIVGRTGTLILAATAVAGTGLLRLEEYGRLGEPPPPAPAPAPSAAFASAVAFAVGFLAVVAMLLVQTDLSWELGDGPYVRAILWAMLAGGVALGALFFATNPSRFQSTRFQLGFVVASALGYWALSEIGQWAFDAFKGLPFYDLSVALTAGIVLSAALCCAAIPLGPILAVRPTATTLGGLGAAVLALVLPITSVAPPPGSIDGVFLGTIGGLLHPQPSTALVVEDGSDAAGALREFPEIDSVEQVSPREARRRCGDEGRYDLVVVNASGLTDTVGAALYTREFHACLMRLLRRGGLVAQRVPLEEADGRVLRLVLASFARAFPDVQVWTSGRDLILLGAAAPIVLDATRLRMWFERPGRLANAVRAYWNAERAEHVVGHYIMSKALLEKAAALTQAHHDDIPEIEFYAPWAMGLRVPSPIDALWRVKMLAADHLPAIRNGTISATSALSGAARGGHLSRSFSLQTASRSLALGGGEEAYRALESLRTTRRPNMSYDAPAEPGPIGFTVKTESHDELPIPERLRGEQGLVR